MKLAPKHLLAVCVFPLSFWACGSQEDMMVDVNPLDGVACVGMVDPAPSGLAQVDDPQLLNDALGKSGDGKLCYGQVFAATAPVTVYRVWNSAKSYTEFGKWWSLIKPTGPVDTYRNDNAICPEWSELNQLTRCTIKVGAHVVIGPGQSANCMMMMYGKSAVNQVYMANDTRVGMLQVENCTQLGAWP
jgi:hypothetical protein